MGNSHQNRNQGHNSCSTYRPKDHQSSGNGNYNREGGARPTQTHSSGNNNNRGAPLGHTQSKGASNNIECFRCGKKGHYANECKDTPRVFAAQVIQEDVDDMSPSHGQTQDVDHGERDELPFPQEDDQGFDHPMDPNGSQCGSGTDEFPLDDKAEHRCTCG